jgi:hypothetical protein
VNRCAQTSRQVSRLVVMAPERPAISLRSGAVPVRGVRGLLPHSQVRQSPPRPFSVHEKPSVAAEDNSHARRVLVLPRDALRHPFRMRKLKVWRREL